jgi:hypothetical protein
MLMQVMVIFKQKLSRHLVGRRQKTAAFDAVFDVVPVRSHTLQGVSPAALDALAAAPGRPSPRGLALAPHHPRYFVEPPHPVQKQDPTSHLAH